MLFISRSKIIFLILLLSFLLFHCSNTEEEVDAENLVSASFLQSAINASPEIRSLFEGFGISANDIRYSASLYKLGYQTSYQGLTINSSAMLAVPERSDLTAPIDPPEQNSISAVQHGTILSNQEAPTEWSIDTALSNMVLLEGLIDTMIGGHISVNVDYFGFGDSRGQFSIHPYLVRDSYPQDVISAIRTARMFARENGIQLNNNLFLRGYSEGAFATLAVQRVIEQNPAIRQEMGLVAVAAAAGSYDLLGTVSDVLQTTLDAPSYAPYVYLAAEQAYSWPMSIINFFFRTDTVVLRGLFNNRIANRATIESNPNLPAEPDELLQPAALESLRNPTIDPNEPDVFRGFKTSLQENSVHEGWTPIAPLRLYHCLGDTTVPPANTSDYASGLVMNNDITSNHNSVDRGVSGYVISTDLSFRHTSCPLYVLPIKEWFNQF